MNTKDDISELVDDVADRCACVRTLRTARSITRQFDTALRPAGLTITQFTLLVTISKMKPESISMIAKSLSMERTSVTRNIALLERGGLVERSRCAAPKKRAVLLTQAGQSKLLEAYPLWQSAQKEIESLFDPHGFDDAMTALKALRDAV